MKDIPEFVWVIIKGVAWMLPLSILTLRSILDLRSADGADHAGSAYIFPVLLVAMILPIVAGITHRSRAVALVAAGIWALLMLAYFLLAPPPEEPRETLGQSLQRDLRRQAQVSRNYRGDVSTALKYSRFKRAMLDSEIAAGQAASHSAVFVQAPKPSASMRATMFSTRAVRSGLPCGNSAICETLAPTNSMADAFLQAATQAPQPMQAAASIALSASCLGTGSALAS